MDGLVLDREPTLQQDETVLARVRSNALPYWLASGGFAVFALAMAFSGRALFAPTEALLASVVMLVLTGLFVRTSRHYVTSRRVVHMQLNKERSLALEDIAEIQRADGLFGTTLRLKTKGLKRGMKLEYVTDPEPVLAALEAARKGAAPQAPPAAEA